MSIVSDNWFNRLEIIEDKKAQCLRLINMSELIERLEKGDEIQPSLNGDGVLIDKWQCLGSFVAIAKGIFSILIGKKENPYIYRGQKKDFGEFIPTALRETSADNIINALIGLKSKNF